LSHTGGKGTPKQDGIAVGHGESAPLISSAHAALTRALNTSRTWASWLADSGSGLREGMCSLSVLPPGPPAGPPGESLGRGDDGEAIVTDVVVC
jgi:hypothetical protein